MRNYCFLSTTICLISTINSFPCKSKRLISIRSCTVNFINHFLKSNNLLFYS